MIRRVSLFVVLCLLVSAPLLADFREFQSIPVDPAMEQQLATIARDALAQYHDAKLTEGNLSITLINMSGPQPRRASFAGSIPYHPASVVKAFYLTSVWDQVEHGKLKLDEPLKAALHDMIVDSSNDATAYVVDRLTGTTGGPELQGRAYRKWEWKRNLTNRYFASLGYDISANGKTWCEGPYGREKQILGPNREHRNRFTSDAFASLMYWIVRKRAVSPHASEEMLALMHRALITDNPPGTNEQVVEFTGSVLPAGSQLWSKAGWTGEVRHDMAYVELPNGHKYVLAVMSRGAADNKTILPWISQRIVEMMQQ